MKAVKCCKVYFLQWRIHPKYFLCMVFVILEMWQMLHGFDAYAASIGYEHLTPWILPLIPGYREQYVVILFAYLLLVSDIPFRTPQQQFVLQRVGKRSWICGQLLYLLCMSILFTFVLWVLSWIFFLPILEWTPRWGKVLTTAANASNVYVSAPPITVSSDILKNTNGLNATIWAGSMQILICFFLGALVMLCNLWTKQGIGIFLAAAIIMLSFFVRSWASMVGFQRYLLWISPVSWVDRSLMGHVNQNLPSFAYGVIMAALLCAAEAFVAIGTIHRCDISITKE